MKIACLIPAVMLCGCSVLSTIIPIKHDPVMFDNLVSTKIAVEKLNCDNKNWTDAEEKLHQLKVYTALRSDPQATSIAQLEEALSKAKKSDNKLFCESILKINKTRLDVVADAWKGR